MGLVIKISFCYDWERIYFVQDLNETEAKEKAFKMFKDTMSCYLPDTLEEAERIVEQWNESYKQNGTYMFDTPKF